MRAGSSIVSLLSVALPRLENWLTDSGVPDDDALLAERVHSGDRDALGELYDRYASVALAVALRVLADRAAAEDVVHDAFVVIWQKIDRFDRSRGSLRSWLLTVVRHRAIDRLRGRRPTMDLVDVDAEALMVSSPNPTWDEALLRISADELRGAIAALPDVQREAIEMAYFGGRTYREIARLTGVPEGTAYGRLRLALGKLRDTLRPTAAAPVAVMTDRVARGPDR